MNERQEYEKVVPMLESLQHSHVNKCKKVKTLVQFRHMSVLGSAE